MTRLQTSAPARRNRAPRIAALSAIAVLAMAQPAMADVPEGWPVADRIPVLTWVLLLVVVPLVSAVIIAALAYALDVAKRGKNAGVHASGSPEAAALGEANTTAVAALTSRR